jgi:hypothetical protein
MKYVAIIQIEDNKDFLKFEDAEELAEHFIRWKHKFKQKSLKKYVVEWMDYPTYRARKDELRKGINKITINRKA